MNESNYERQLEFLATKSNEFINQQINSYRAKHSNSGIIITVLALFIPIFLQGLSESYTYLKFCSIIPVVLLLYSIILLINILKTKSLDIGFNFSKFDNLITTNYDKVLLYEIGANKSSFLDNENVIKSIEKRYNFAIQLGVIAIVISAIVLLLNQIDRPKKEVSKTEKINFQYMIPENSQNSSNLSPGEDDDSTSEPIIPFVPPSDRTNISGNSTE